MTKCNSQDGVYVLVQCSDCPELVKVPTKGQRRKRCNACKRSAQLESVQRWRLRRAGDTSPAVQVRKRGAPPGPREESRVDPREYGPAKPQLGMDEHEARAYRTRRIAHLYRTEPELSVLALCERFGVTSTVVYKALEDSGVPVRKQSDTLPAGLPL